MGVVYYIRSCCDTGHETEGTQGFKKLEDALNECERMKKEMKKEFVGYHKSWVVSREMNTNIPLEPYISFGSSETHLVANEALNHIVNDAIFKASILDRYENW